MFLFSLTICVYSTNDAYPDADKPRDIHNCTTECEERTFVYSNLRGSFAAKGSFRLGVSRRKWAFLLTATTSRRQKRRFNVSWARPRETLRRYRAVWAQGEYKKRGEWVSHSPVHSVSLSASHFPPSISLSLWDGATKSQQKPPSLRIWRKTTISRVYIPAHIFPANRIFSFVVGVSFLRLLHFFHLFPQNRE